VLAQSVANVFSSLNESPPGPLLSLGLLGLHASSFLIALFMSGAILILREGLK
jgi:hypothetical protein